MKYALNLAEDNRILSAAYIKYASPNAVFVDELPEGDIYEYLYVGGKYIHDPLPKPIEPEPVDPNAAVWDAIAEAITEGVDDVE